MLSKAKVSRCSFGYWFSSKDGRGGVYTKRIGESTIEGVVQGDGFVGWHGRGLDSGIGGTCINRKV
jgi:hypothetical protein